MNYTDNVKENSRSGNQPDDLLNTVVTNKAEIKKKSTVNKIADLFFRESLSDAITNTFIREVVPGIQGIIVDMVAGTVERMFDVGTRKYTNRRNPERIDYSKASSEKYDRREAHKVEEREYQNAKVSNHPICGNLKVETEREAEELISKMEMCFERFGWVRVSNLNTWIGVTGEPADENWGWNDLRRVSYSKLSGRDGGWLINLPDPIPVKK